jgi:hypothetical protein
MYNNLTENEVVEYIKQIVLIYLNAPPEYYTKKTRKHEVLKIKQYACYFAKRHTSLSNKTIADLFNLKNHSSIISLVKKIDGYATFDKQAKKELKEIEDIIRLKGLSKNNKVDFEKYYYINMNDFKSVRENPERAIVFIGYNDNEIIDLLRNKPESRFEIVNHKHTQKFILDQNENEQNEPR